MGERGKTEVSETLGVSAGTLTRFGESKRLGPRLPGRWKGAYWRGRVGGGPVAPRGDAEGEAGWVGDDGAGWNCVGRRHR